MHKKSKRVLKNLDSEKYALSTPIEITIENRGKRFVAVWKEAEIFGAGDTKIEAIDDLKYIISRTYDHLEILPDMPMKSSLSRFIIGNPNNNHSHRSLRMQNTEEKIE